VTVIHHDVNTEAVKNIVKHLGYEVVDHHAGVFSIKGSSGIKIVCAVEHDIFKITVPLITVTEAKLTREVALSMLWHDNGLATSHLELVKAKGGKVKVILMNYCKLQELGEDDQDDIATALEFSELDVVRARKILKGLS
jgi:hypothetical protein